MTPCDPAGIPATLPSAGEGEDDEDAAARDRRLDVDFEGTAAARLLRKPRMTWWASERSFSWMKACREAAGAGRTSPADASAEVGISVAGTSTIVTL